MISLKLDSLKLICFNQFLIVLGVPLLSQQQREQHVKGREGLVLVYIMCILAVSTACRVFLFFVIMN